MSEDLFPLTIRAAPEDAGQRLDRFLAARLPEVSRVRLQQLIADGKVLVAGAPARASLRLRGGEMIELTAAPQAPPLRALPEDIPLDVVYEDDDLAVINKPAGMAVHAPAGPAEKARGTLVNALLHRFGALSAAGGALRPGIVHRLDKQTSGLMVVARNDRAHRRLAAQFAGRQVKKTYIALVHGWLKQERGTVSAAISRDRVRRTRMTTRRREGRAAVTHYRVLRRINSEFGRFSLLEVKIETGRTHQIRVHLASLGHPVVGDTLYGAPRQLKSAQGRVTTLGRNFLHATAIELAQPSTGAPLAFSQPLPRDLEDFLHSLEAPAKPAERL